MTEQLTDLQSKIPAGFQTTLSNQQTAQIEGHTELTTKWVKNGFLGMPGGIGCLVNADVEPYLGLLCTLYHDSIPE